MSMDFAGKVYNEYGKFTFEAAISPKRLMVDDYVVKSLDWKSVPYGKKHKNKVPNDKRGIYAFVIRHPSKVLPPHGYVLYIGIVGKSSDRSLRERYQDYLNRGKNQKRWNIKTMIETWKDVLQFFYAPVEDEFSSSNLQKLEKQLNTALVPCFVLEDLDADVKEMRKAWKR